MRITHLLARIPSIGWIILIPLGLVAFIGSIILLFWLLSSVEGFASILFLIIGFFVFWGLAAGMSTGEGSRAFRSFSLAGVIVFFALMGMAVDQTGNVLYNKPIEIIFCPAGSHLSRGIDVFHPLPGRTDVVQRFTCLDSNEKPVSIIGLEWVILTRFVTYILLAYLLYGLGKILVWLRRKRQQPFQS